MRKLIFIFVLFLFFGSFAIAKIHAKIKRVDPICSASHVNYLNQTDLSHQLSLMQQAGIHWTRFDFFWIDMETSPGVYNFSKYDNILNTANSYGIKLIAMVPQYGIPSWYRQNSSDFMSPPQNPQDYGNFLQALSLHFKSAIILYEMGNEPNINWGNPSTPNVASYSAMLKAGYMGVKASDPGAKVITGGLANISANDFLNGMYANGAKGYFDYLGFHPYSWPRSPDDTTNATNFAVSQTLENTMLANGDNKQIMATEIGWPSTTASGGVDEATQASYINRVYQKIEYENFTYIPIACIYDFTNDGTDQANPEDNFGLLRFDYTQKPSYTTMQSVRSDYNNHFIPINP